MRITRSTVVASLSGLVFLIGGVAVGSFAAAGSTLDKNGRNPEAGLSDAQRAAIHQQAHRLNDQYLQRFVASKADPHGLPVIEAFTYAAPPASLAAATASAAVIAVGRVKSTTFQVNPSGGLPVATSDLKIERVLKGQNLAADILVRQLGGPVAHFSGGALAELDSDRLLLPNDHVLVMLTQGGGGYYLTVAAAGVNEIGSDGKLAAEDGNPFAAALNGKTVQEFARLIGA